MKEEYFHTLTGKNIRKNIVKEGFSFSKKTKEQLDPFNDFLKPKYNTTNRMIDLLTYFPNNYLKPQKPILIQSNLALYKPNLNPFLKPGITVDTYTRITADNVAEFAYPLAQYIEQVKPDYIVACDRGARIIGLAVHMLYRRLYGALPTRDHTISFRKISTSVPIEVIKEVLQPDIKHMLATVESPTVLVLDDWVTTGKTKDLVYELFAELSQNRVNVLYGVMRGEGADITGNKDSSAFSDWHDRVDLIGVDYNSNDLRPSKVDSKTPLEYRKRMIVSIKKFVRELQIKSVTI